jgi:hypothetical protein
LRGKIAHAVHKILSPDSIDAPAGIAAESWLGTYARVGYFG